MSILFLKKDFKMNDITLKNSLNRIKTQIYDQCSLKLTQFQIEPESKEYDACQFQLNQLKILCRNAKITPKKAGQFVTFWKRSASGIIEPYNENDSIDLFIVNVETKEQLGQFVFPKSILIKKGILSTKNKEGKRAFRVYPLWDTVQSKQAANTQKWQLNYFYIINNATDLADVKSLFQNS